MCVGSIGKNVVCPLSFRMAIDATVFGPFAYGLIILIYVVWSLFQKK